MLPKEAMLPREALWTRERALAIVVALANVAGALWTGTPVDALDIALYCILPVLCVWYPDMLAERSGFGLLWAGIPITRSTPASIVRIVGWGFLALPLTLAIVAVWAAWA